MKNHLLKKSVVGATLLAIFSACGVIYLAGAEMMAVDAVSSIQPNKGKAKVVVAAKKKKVRHESSAR